MSSIVPTVMPTVMPMSIEPSDEEESVQDYDFVKQIGSGSTCDVFFAKYKPQDMPVAIKVIPLHKRSKNKLNQEINAMIDMQNTRCSIQLYTTFRDKYFFYIVMEYIEGEDLHTYLSHRKSLALNQLRYIIACLTDAIDEIHQLAYIHRDIKPENIIISLEGIIKICDFGMSTKLSSNYERAYTVCGTRGYIAPEIFTKNGYNQKVDIWAFGMVIDEILDLAIDKEGDNKYSYDLLIDLIEKMLDPNCETRIDIIKAKDHDFFDGINWIHIRNLTYTSPLL